jgi:uncharacterized protein YecT (DUF1311 family)
MLKLILALTVSLAIAAPAFARTGMHKKPAQANRAPASEKEDEEPALNCDEPRNQTEINMCSWEEVKKTHPAWAKAIREARNRIRKRGDDNEYDKQLASVMSAAFRDSHKAFKKYMETQCALTVLDSTGLGSMGSAERGACAVELIQQRIEFLNGLAKD